MKKIAYVALGIGVISLIIGIISRLTLIPVGAVGLEAQAFLGLANTCLLISIALALLEKK